MVYIKIVNQAKKKKKARMKGYSKVDQLLIHADFNSQISPPPNATTSNVTKRAMIGQLEGTHENKNALVTWLKF